MSKQQTGKAQYQQEENLLIHSDALMELLAKRGLVSDKQISNEKKRAAEQEKKRASYHNTLLLLQHYRSMVWMLETAPEWIAQELNQPFQGVDALIEKLDIKMAWGDSSLENRLGALKKSRVLLDRVNEALTVLKKKPENGEKLYDLIYQTYITPEKVSHAELLYRLDISSRHYYRLRQQAINILSIRLWSVPSANLELWMDVMTALEEME